jgi:hypothetical protein
MCNRNDGTASNVLLGRVRMDRVDAAELVRDGVRARARRRTVLPADFVGQLRKRRMDGGAWMLA